MSPARAHATLASPLARRPRRLRVTWVRSFAGVGRVVADLARRAADVSGALLLLTVLSPVWIIRGAIGLAHQEALIEHDRRIGRFREPFRLLRFSGTGIGRGLPVLVNILRGDMSFAGPRPMTQQEADAIPPDGLVRFAVRPGLVSRHTLQKRTGIAHDAEVSADREHYYEQTLRGDLGLVARSIPATILGNRDEIAAPPFLDFFGVTIVNTTMDEAIDWIQARAADRDRTPSQIAFVNPDCLNIAHAHEEYRAVLQGSDRVLPDGIGIHVGCRLLGTPLKENVNGTDLFPRLCERAAQTGQSIYLLGARPGLAMATADAMQAKYPGLAIAGARHGYFTQEQEQDVIDDINASGASILLVAFGVPRQELWLAKTRDRLHIPVQMGVGGLFDFYSGRIARAPQWLRELGMEWSWRLLQEPGRMWRRYLVGNWVFLYRVWKQSRRSPAPHAQGAS